MGYNPQESRGVRPIVRWIIAAEPRDYTAENPVILF